jgi:gentisate 1,2-dioxygenase
MAAEQFQARYKTAAELRKTGGIGNLAQGPEVVFHGMPTRFIAWPGNGFQTESVHVLTLRPGLESERYAYQLSEEAYLCHHGDGEVFLRDQWHPMKPGDMAYFPEGAPRAFRNPGGRAADFLLVSQTTPPQLEVYAASGLYNQRHGGMDYTACDRATLNAEPAEYPDSYEMEYHEHSPDLRPWNLPPEEVRARGALFNIYRGAPFSGLGVDSFRLILWPGAGTRTVGFNFTHWPGNVPEAMHIHPLSDECLVLWKGRAQFYMGAGWIDVEANDVALAPQGIWHGTRNQEDCVYGGFASPPQLDLLLNSGFYQDGLFLRAPFKRLEA